MTAYLIPPYTTDIWQQPIIDKDLTVPPVSPSKGDRYILLSFGGWLNISSANYDSDCGHDASYTVQGALDGTTNWQHYDPTMQHWFIIDLGSSKNITKVRGRSNLGYDPTNVNIYVSDSKTVWEDAVATGITTWQDTDTFVEINTTEKSGRYIKVEITATEYANYITFGASPVSTIFDAYNYIAPSGSWINHSNDIAYYDGSNWQFITPTEGFICWVKDENKYYCFNGTSWVITSII